MKRSRSLRSQDVVDVLGQVRGRSATFATIARRLGVSGRRRSALRELLAVLEQEGKIVRKERGRYALPDIPRVVSGTYRGRGKGQGGSRGGYGFVTRENGGRDIYVAQADAGAALDGDTVTVSVRWPPGAPGPAGEVVAVERRARDVIVGTYRRYGRHGLVEPKDRRMAVRFAVSDAESGGASDGDLVVARVVRWPGEGVALEAQVTEVLGPPEQPGMDGVAIARSFGLPLEFPADVLEEAATLPDAITDDDLAGRHDLRAALTYTIDPERAQDFDDAISVQQTERGYRVGVHIADVSHYVVEGSAIDGEAFDRGTSVYLADRTLHMLPPRLSADLASLKSGTDRLTRSVELEIDDSGRVVKHRYFRSAIRSRARLTYEEAQDVIDRASKGGRSRRAGSTGPATEEIAESLRVADAVARLLRSRRFARGSLDLELPEVEVDVNEAGRPRAVRNVARLSSHRLIEEFMIAANEAVAKRLRAKGLPTLYRIHEPPSREKLEALSEVAGRLGHRFSARAGGTKPFQQLLDRTRGTAEGVLVAILVLRTMKRARYAVDNAGHFALASRCYTHFTSPIRRYPDLVVHRLLGRRRRPRRERDAPRLRRQLERIALRSTQQEWLAEEAERLSVRAKIIQYLAGHLGEEFSAIITRIFPSGVLAYIEDFDVESFVPVENLEDDYYRYDSRSQTLLGRRHGRRLALGGRVTLSLARVDVQGDELDLVMGPQ
ncbi:hypothetical protein AMJ71_10680 [candidate division TA06 bacterium SM1_40]|uniref:Ribonuclease R n=1 Tax=candidate division TA06 bacterium SM1_40 TaxID=1703773 RepID=A0A0S8J948_UNCT6|nr:MAG: hypothetical protein AMJ71_10680 [candidate division TA06 bacterium SM1_40]